MPDRIIRSGLIDSERYLGLGSDSVRLLFIHLLLSADPFGNVEAGTTFLRRRVLAVQADDRAIGAMLNELADADLVRLYEVDRKCYLHIPRYRQRLRYVKRVHPLPPTTLIEADDLRRINEVEEESPGDLQVITSKSQLEVKRSEVKRSEEQKVSPVRATRLPADWRLPDEWRDWAVNVYHMEPQRAVRISLAFRDFWIAKPGGDGTKLDWYATWRNWVRKEMQDA